MKNLYKIIVYMIASLFLLAGCSEQEESKQASIQKVQKENIDTAKIKKELQNLHTISYLEEYIQDVIINGSDNKLGFPSGAMEGGFAHSQDASDIAKYVVMLAGKKSSDDAKGAKAALFYTSNCGGCHGNDGKGLDGTFPDLTLQTLEGLKLKEKSLQKTLSKALQNPS